MDSDTSTFTPKKKSFFQKTNLLFGILFLVLGFFFIVNHVIMKNPHQVASDKKQTHSEKELETKDAFTYEHEKGGDRELRIITAQVLLFLGFVCFIIAGLLFFGMNEDSKFKNKGLKITTFVFAGLFLCGLIYYFIYKSGALNKKSNEKFDNIVKEEQCKSEGVSIIYNPCARDDIIELYNTCIQPVKSRLEAKCAVDLLSYNIVKPSDGTTSFDTALRGTTLSVATYNFYKELDKNPSAPLTCERVVNSQVENHPNNKKCAVSSNKEFKETQKHKDCSRNAERQSKFDPNNIYNKDTHEGTTFSNCTERKKYMQLKKDNLKKNIEREMESMPPPDPATVPEFTETTSSSTRTDSRIATSSQ